MKLHHALAAGVIVAELGTFSFGCSSNPNSRDPRTPGQKMEDGAKDTGSGIGDAAKQGAEKTKEGAQKAGAAVKDAVTPNGGAPNQ